MRKKEKIIAIVLILVIIACIIFSILIIKSKNKTTKKEDSSLNFVTKDSIIKDQTLNGLKISDISIMYGEEMSTYMATVTNTTNTSYKVDQLFVNFFIEKSTFSGIIMENVELGPNESQTVNLQIDRDLSKCSKITYSTELLIND